MKTRIFIIASVSLFFSSCADFLQEDPKSLISESNFFKTDKDAIAAVNSVYAVLRAEGILLNNYALNEVPADNLRPKEVGSPKDRTDIDKWTYDNTNSFFSAAWTNSYTAINRANIVLKYVQIGGKTSQAIANRVYAEARFLRAWNYFRLIDLFRDVPLITEPVSDPNDITPGRTSMAKIYDLIIEDLKFAETNLDDKYSYTDIQNGGRVTKGVAKTYLGKVYLTMAGWPMNKGAAYYQLAADKLKEVVDNKAAYGYDLMTNYAEIFDVNKKATNKEAIWYLQGTTGLPQTAQYFTRMHSFFISYYSWQPSFKTAGMVYSPSTYLQYSASGLYDLADKRRALNIGRTTATAVIPAETDLLGTPAAGFLEVVKYADFVGKADGKNDLPFTRYSDVILMYAEALCELNGAANLTSAATLLNPIRTRAGFGAISYTDQNELRNHIRAERNRELAFEGHRRSDLIRWGNYISVMKDALKREFPTESFDYITESLIFFPIPSSEISVNPNLLNPIIE